MFRWLLEKFAVRPHFKEDPYFKVQVREDLDRGLVRVSVDLIRSSARWRGKFTVESRPAYPLEIHVPESYKRDGEYFLLEDYLSDENGVSIEFKADPLRTGSGNVRFWFERKVGLGGQISVIGRVFGQGDQDAIRRSESYFARNWSKWLEDNPDWNDTESR